MKNYKLEWLPKSVGDLGQHIAFINKVSPEAATRTAASVVDAANSLVTFPERFPEFPMPQNFPIVIRKCVVEGRYVILFSVGKEAVTVYRVLDARKKFDGLLG